MLHGGVVSMICRTRGPGHQNAVWPQFEVWVFVCIVDVPDDLLWVKQDNEIMRQERLSVVGMISARLLSIRLRA